MSDEQQHVNLDAEQPPQPRSSKMKTVIGLSVLALLVGLLAGYLFTREREVFIPRPLTHNMPTVTCRPVTKDDLEMLAKDVHWQHTVRSMYWHMSTNKLEGISAFHMGDPTCFVLVRLSNSETVLPMFNVVFRGYSTNSIMARNEESLACPGVIRNMLRALHVRASYIDGNTGEPMVELFSGAEAFALQHVNFYSLGHTICDLHATNADEGVTTLRRRLVADTSL